MLPGLIQITNDFGLECCIGEGKSKNNITGSYPWFPKNPAGHKVTLKLSPTKSEDESILESVDSRLK